LIKNLPWPRVVAEGTLIVVSILLALGIDTWWSGVQDRRLVADYVSRIEDDLSIDTVQWRAMVEAMTPKQEALDRVGAWLDTPDFAESAVRTFLEDLAAGAQRSYGLGTRAERVAFDELVSTGRLQLLNSELREALLRYHSAVDFQRARIEARESTYAATVYELTPRDPGSDATLLKGMPAPALERLARRALAEDLAGPLVAERNLSQLRAGVAGGLLGQATALLVLIRRVSGKGPRLQ